MQKFLFSARQRPRQSASGFTLIELLVVIAIIGVLLAVLLPSLKTARDQAKLTICGQHLRQLGTAVYAYAGDYHQKIPCGSELPCAIDPSQSWAAIGDNWIWAIPPYFPDGQGRLNAHGVLLRGYLVDGLAMFCADSNNMPAVAANLNSIESSAVDGFSTYIYRQLDQTSHDSLDDPGLNEAGQPARALFADNNQFGPGTFVSTNHEAQRVNLGYLDGHVKSLDNRGEWFTGRAADYVGFPASIVRRLDQIWVNADWAEERDPATAPILP